MTLQVSRIPAFTGPMDWKNHGDSVVVSGRFATGSPSAARILREQLLGYNLNRDEPVIPIISTADDRLTGFYRVGSIEVPTPPMLLASNGVLEYVLQADRVPGYATPQMESFITGALMVNSSGITTTAEPFHAFDTVFEYNLNVAGYTVENRPMADGSTTLAWVRMNPTGAAPTYKALARWTQLPGDYLKGACELRSSLLADHVVVGQQESVPSTAWTLRNGLVQIGPNFGTITWADASNTYRTSVLMGFPLTAGRSWGTPANSVIKIMRNAPEECIIRVPLQPSDFTGWPPANYGGLSLTPTCLDISIRRGSRIVRFFMTMSSATSPTFGNQVPVASSAITGGNIWTANDGNGNRVGIFSATAVNNDLTRGRFGPSASVTAWDFGVTMELGGTGSTNRDTIASQFLQYLAAQAERQQIVAR